MDHYGRVAGVLQHVVIAGYYVSIVVWVSIAWVRGDIRGIIIGVG